MGINAKLLEYLIQKGYKTDNERRRYLFPKLSDHYNPFLLKGMQEAVKVIADALKTHKSILVWGDADLDGIVSTAMLKSALEDLGADNVKIRIPKRGGEGFGLNTLELKRIKESGIDLVVTVDVGTTNIAEVQFANEIGLKIIITDHHEVIGKLPETLAINPKRSDSTYPFRELAGAGVVLKLITALYEKKVKLSINELANLRPHYWMFAALGTVSDRTPLIDENRLIVREGMQHLRGRKWVSFDVWLKVMQLDAETLSVFDLYSRGISPFYASDPEEGVRLLLSKERAWLSLKYEELRELAVKWQRGRQGVIEAVKNVSRQLGGMIVAVCEDIDSGYLGTAAYALRETYNLPAIVLSPRDNLWHAECRGMNRTNLLAYLSNFGDMYLSFGGHRKACGFTLKKGMRDKFLKAIENNPIELLERDPEPEVPFEMDITQDFSNWTLLAPFGEGNPSPRLFARNVRIIEKAGAYEANGIPVYLPMSLRVISSYDSVFNIEYTINADGAVRILNIIHI